ncbi:MAG: ferrous iron transport protein A [Desulfovibrionaceae bacterium]|nr:ferrous iron transport protein A [Desulfovibrionaceae bacterium]
MTLNELSKKTACRVKRVNAKGMLGQRLADMGFCPGEEILFVRKAPLGDPVQVQMGTYHVVLRKAEAREIEVGDLR